MIKEYLKPLVAGIVVALIVIVIAFMMIFDSPAKFPNKLQTIDLFDDGKQKVAEPSTTPVVAQKEEISSDSGKTATASGTPTPTPDKITATMPEMKIDQKKKYTATFKTSVGEIDVELFASKTPITVNNFVGLARKGFYDNTIFHRVIAGFMIQGGDPKGDGTGGPGYKFDDEPFDGEYTRGTLAMANAGPNTNGSQFFIMHKDTPLPKNYVIFGKVSKGLEVVDKIATAPVESSPFGEGSKPVKPVKVSTITIEEK